MNVININTRMPAIRHSYDRVRYIYITRFSDGTVHEYDDDGNVSVLKRDGFEISLDYANNKAYMVDANGETATIENFGTYCTVAWEDGTVDTCLYDEDV